MAAKLRWKFRSEWNSFVTQFIKQMSAESSRNYRIAQKLGQYLRLCVGGVFNFYQLSAEKLFIAFQGKYWRFPSSRVDSRQLSWLIIDWLPLFVPRINYLFNQRQSNLDVIAPATDLNNSDGHSPRVGGVHGSVAPWAARYDRVAAIHHGALADWERSQSIKVFADTRVVGGERAIW